MRPELQEIRFRRTNNLGEKLIVSVRLDPLRLYVEFTPEEEQNNPYNTEGPQEDDDLWYNRITRSPIHRIRLYEMDRRSK